MRIGNREFDTANKTYVMGILNVTPDSFSDGGRYNSTDRALAQTERMIGEGADIIDIGGESTRPGYTKISDEEEIGRVTPVIEAVKARFDIPVSLDTYKSKVAQAGLEAGADLINDIWGLKYDGDMGRVIADSEAACCLMHNREQADYTDFEREWCEDLAGTVRLAKKAGIRDDRIILDPGVGFGKTYENNLTAIRRMDRLMQFGYPVLLGTSRKSVIGLTLDVPADERVIGTVATTVYAMNCGCAFVRVHDVKENVQAIRMMEAIRNS
ncbi:MAG: dihydropteroate synthase [Clostridiales bacterium]|nr:dihydropteroate synthase [Clostridiales bacterium]